MGVVEESFVAGQGISLAGCATEPLTHLHIFPAEAGAGRIADRVMVLSDELLVRRMLKRDLRNEGARRT